MEIFKYNYIMVKVHTETRTIKNLFDLNTESIEYGKIMLNIVIESDFQRGDRESGVWNNKQQKNYIDALKKYYPTGIITFVENDNCLNVLDGGNRLRTIRDYINNKFNDLDNRKYSDLEADPKAEFKNIVIPCQRITIENTDPYDTIAKMFCGLNTSAAPLSQGELFKAHGWKQNIWEIEVSKKLIGHIWSSAYNDPTNDIFVDEDNTLSNIRDKWNSTINKDNDFGELQETKRCDNLAMMIGYIISAKTSKFELFDKRYVKLKDELSEPNVIPSIDKFEDIINKLNKFLNILSNINIVESLGPKCVVKGIPSQSKIAPIWKKICDNSMNDVFETKLINFYKDIEANKSVKNIYNQLLTAGGNGETTNSKINSIFDYIEENY